MKKIFVLLMVLSLVIVGIPKLKLKAQVNDDVSYSYKNMAFPDLEGKGYLGDGNYLLFSERGLSLTYNIFTGIFTRQGDLIGPSFEYPLVFNIGKNEPITISSYLITEGIGKTQLWEKPNLHLLDINNSVTFNTSSQFEYLFLNFYSVGGLEQFKLQIEKGNTVSSYQVPLEPYLFHERNDAYRNGYYDASLFSFPENLAEWYSDQLYSNYYHMTTGKISLDTTRIGISVFVPDFSNIITSAGQGTEQKIIFYDINDNEIFSQSVFGRLTGRFDYSIPLGASSFSYSVLVQGPLPSNYVTEWNNLAYVAYKDLLTTYGEAWQEGYDEGYEYGIDAGKSIGYLEGRDYGYELGKVEAIDLYKDEWFEQGKSVGYAEGLEDNVATGGFIMILSSAFIGVSTLLGIELLPNITLGMIVAVPLVFGILFFILGKKKD